MKTAFLFLVLLIIPQLCLADSDPTPTPTPTATPTPDPYVGTWNGATSLASSTCPRKYTKALASAANKNIVLQLFKVGSQYSDERGNLYTRSGSRYCHRSRNSLLNSMLRCNMVSSSCFKKVGSRLALQVSTDVPCSSCKVNLNGSLGK